MSKIRNEERRQELLRPRTLSRLLRLLGLRLLRLGLRRGLLRIRSAGRIRIAERISSGAGSTGVWRTEDRAERLAKRSGLCRLSKLLLCRVGLIFERIPNEFPVLIFLCTLVELHRF